jgi:ABC-type multidrug transport system fused ATPase/permease subunit
MAVDIMLMRCSTVKKDGSSGDLNGCSSDDSSSASSGHLAIKKMNLSIAPGEKVAVCGSSGR